MTIIVIVNIIVVNKIKIIIIIKKNKIVPVCSHFLIFIKI